MFYRAKNTLKRGMRIKLDLTKSRYDLSKIPAITFCYADINCLLKVKFNDEDQKDIFYSSINDLRDTADMEI